MDTGKRVKGKYAGEFSFSGTVTTRRPVTVQTDGCWVHTIKLDEPLEVYGDIREIILVGTLYDGSPSSYVRYQDVMQEII